MEHKYQVEIESEGVVVSSEYQVLMNSIFSPWGWTSDISRVYVVRSSEPGMEGEYQRRIRTRRMGAMLWEMVTVKLTKAS